MFQDVNMSLTTVHMYSCFYTPCANEKKVTKHACDPQLFVVKSNGLCTLVSPSLFPSMDEAV